MRRYLRALPSVAQSYFALQLIIAPHSPAEAQVCANCVLLRESVVSLANVNYRAKLQYSREEEG